MEKDNKARCALAIVPHIAEHKWDKLETFKKLMTSVIPRLQPLNY